MTGHAQTVPNVRDTVTADSSKGKTLEGVEVRSRHKGRQIGAAELSQQQLTKEMTSDIRDLVRYTPGVGISYSGTRGGTRGFAIRGVEANRVAISVDGIQQPEIHENMVFSAYGLSNASRIEFDPYFVSAIDIQKGASSFTIGSGALGGAVNYTTRRAGDLISNGNDFGATTQINYNGKDKMRMYLGGVGYKKDKWEGLLMFANRHGNEIQNFSYGHLTRNVTSTRLDPIDYNQQTLLGKVGFVPNERHRVDLGYYMLNKKINSEIWSQEPLDIFTSSDKPYYFGHDQSLSHSFTLDYAFTPENNWLKKAALKANLQNTYLDASTWSEYYRPNFYGGGSYDLTYEGRRDKYRGQEIKDKTVRANFDFQPLESGTLGLHRFSLFAAVADKYNDNRNVDVENPMASNKLDGYTVRFGNRYEFGESIGKIINSYSFQRSINRQNYQIGFVDNILLIPNLTLSLGARYDYFKTKDNDWSYNNDQYYMDYLMRNMQDVKMNMKRINDADQGLSWLATANYRFFRFLNIGYKFSTGFRVPTTEERYFQYFNSWPSFLVLSNRALKPETSINHEVEIAGEGEWGTYIINAYTTNYKNFIDIEQGTIAVTNSLDRSTKNISYAKNVNRQSADLLGIDAKLYLQLAPLWSRLHHFSLNAAASYAQGETSYGTSMLGVQPLSGYLGLEYLSFNQKLNANIKVNGFMAKDRQDTRFIEKTATKEIRRTYPALFLNDAYTVDMYGSYQIIRNLTIRAGVYNLFNQKYWRWDDLRQLTNPALLPHIENFFREGSKTITRFSQPKRYFSLSLEFNI